MGTTPAGTFSWWFGLKEGLTKSIADDFICIPEGISLAVVLNKKIEHHQWNFPLQMFSVLVTSPLKFIGDVAKKLQYMR